MEQDNYHIDEQFMNQAWGEMETLLDKEMPVQKRKRRFALWWFWGVSAASLGLLLFFSFPHLKKSFNKNIATQEKVATTTSSAERQETTPVVPSDMVDISASENQKTPKSALPPKPHETALSSTESTTKVITPIAKLTIDKPSKLDIKPTASIPTSAEIKISDTAIQSTNTVSESSVLNKQSPVAVAFLPKERLLPLAYQAPVEILNLESQNHRSIKISTFWRHSALLAWQQYFDAKYDVQFAYQAHWQRNRWQLSSGLGISFANEWSLGEKDAVFADIEEEDVPEIEVSTTVDMEEDTFTGGNTSPEIMVDSMNKMLFLPLSARYQFGRFALFTDGRVLYDLLKNQPTPNASSMNSRGQTNTAPQRWYYQFGGGFSYELGQKWQLDMSYQQRFQTNEKAVLVGLHYYFK